MNHEDLEYLREMEKELYIKLYVRPITDEEIDKVSDALRTNVGGQDDTTALDIVANIIQRQSTKVDVEKLHGLVDEVIYHGELLGAEGAVYSARMVEQRIAAKFIDEERYDEFKDMMAKGFDPHAEQNGWSLMNRVKTLKGAEFMETEGFIPSGYFTEDFTDGDASLLYAFPEQIDFYIAHGADVNAEDNFGQNVLNHMLYRSRPTEAIEKVVNAGGDISDCEDAWWHLKDRVTKGFYGQLEEYGRQSIGRTLENINLLIKHGYELNYEDVVAITANLVRETPEFLKVFKPNLEKEELFRLKSKIEERRQRDSQPNDPLQEKQEAMEKAILKENRGRERVMGMREYLRRVLKGEGEYKFGKTGDSNTRGEATEAQKKTGKIQEKVAKDFMATPENIERIKKTKGGR